jgi:signal transduction histidine kinase
MNGFADLVAAEWPLVATVAMAVMAERLRAGRRRTALNRAMHEVRRPLQALALSPPPAQAPAIPGPAPLDLAIAALEDLDREINGSGDPRREWRPVAARELAGGAVARWRGRALIAGGTIELRWDAGEAVVMGDPARLSQALDNLILNSLQHGGPQIRVEGRRSSESLLLLVSDDGRDARPPSRRGSPGEVIARLTGRRRRGHGLRIVREMAEAHGGRFVLRHSGAGACAVLEVPLLGRAGFRAA